MATYVAGVALWVCSFLAELHYGWLPSQQNLWIIAIGMLLVAGALAAGWPERNLYAEHAFQFNVMASFLTRAERRLAGHLRVIDENPHSADVIRERIEAMQRVFYEIGIQTLDENTEWLMLHRARPFEPVMAG